MNSDWGQKGSGPIADRRKKLEKLRGLGIDPFSQDFCVGQDVGSLVSRYRGLEVGELDRLGGKFSVAGRVMGKRDFGKASFLDLKDGTGKIQCFVESASLSSEDRAIFGCLDVGDHLGVTGRIFKTRTGELTIRVEQLRILSKALRPLPEKWHGIRDVEARYRRRYLDLLMNPKARDCFRVRTQVVRAIRDFLDGRGFQEVETPMMQVLPGGAEALPFVTHHNALDIDLYLRIAPELYLKRLVIGGMERVYEINRNFRNEGISTQHNPEFTMLEFYQAYATFEDLMVTTEELFESLLERLHLGPVLSFQGKQIRMSRPWRKIRFLEGMVEIGKVPPEGLQDLEGLKGLALERGVNIDGRQSPAKILAKLFDVLVEPKLQDPTFVTHHPVEISPLARRNPQEPHLADRFELYIGGREIANAFTELTDPDDQRERFVQQKALREAGDQEAHPLDEDFLRALEHGMPPTAGEGIGIDRVVMLLTDSPSIRDVILFPLQRKEAQ